MRLLHINAAGLMGGNSLCGGQGDVHMLEKEANCEQCIELAIKYSLFRGWDLTSPNLVQAQALHHYVNDVYT